MIKFNEKEIDINFDIERELQCCVVGDGIDYSASIINKEGVVIQSHRFGFGYNCVVPSAEEYLNWFIHNGHKDPYRFLAFNLN